MVTIDAGMRSAKRGVVHGFYKDWIVVSLNDGYWAKDEDNKILSYISMLLVHPGNITEGWE